MKRKILSILLALTILLSAVMPAGAVCYSFGRYRLCFGSKPTAQAAKPVQPAQTVQTVPSVQTVQTVSASDYEKQVVSLVNAERSRYGLAALAIREDLCSGARKKSSDMQKNGYFSHTSPTYGSPFQMMKTLGISYRSAGENIAMGYPSPKTVVNAWMNSAGHRANILSANYTAIGVGYVPAGHYWTQWFVG